MDKKTICIIGLLTIFMGMFFLPEIISAQEKKQEMTDDQKMDKAIDIFKKFKEQSVGIDRESLSRMNYLSLYRSNLRNSLIWSARLADFGDCEKRVKQYNTAMKLRYKEKNQLTPDKETKIDDWSQEIKDRCGEQELDLLDFIDTAINTCQDSLEKYTFSNPTSMMDDKTVREDMNNFLSNDESFTKFKEKSDRVLEYYPDVYAKISTEVERWTRPMGKQFRRGKLPPMK